MATNYTDMKQNRAVAPKKEDSIPAMLQKMRPEFERALPRHMNADRMLRIVLTEFRKNPDLEQCSQRSLLGSIVTLAQLGLEPGVLGQAYLIPYKGICTPVPGWQGIADLVGRSGRASVWTGAVYEGDEFSYNYGDRPFIEHRPGDQEDDARLLYVYAVGRIKNAEWPIIEVWSTAKVLKHRNRFNKVGEKHYSYNHFEMYARKVALLQVIKYMPKSVELQTAVDLENAATSGEPGGTIIDGAAWPSDGDMPPASTGKPAEPEARKPTEEDPRKPQDQPKEKAPDADPRGEPQAEGQGATSETENQQESQDQDAEPRMDFGAAFNAITKAKTAEDFDYIRSCIKHLPETKRKTIETSITNKIAELNKKKSGATATLE